MAERRRFEFSHIGWLVDHRDPRSVASRMRRRRLRHLRRIVDSFDAPVRVLDVGGTPAYWTPVLDELPPEVSITVLNQTLPTGPNPPNVVCAEGDGRDLRQYATASFDVCYSNSVIEHVGGDTEQRAFAAEVRRVATYHVVQTPNRYFPLEPHFLVPFWQFLPTSVRVEILRRTRVGWVRQQPDPVRARRTIESVRLLSRRQLAAMFPRSTVHAERIGPLTKSWIAVGRCDG